MDGTTKKSKLPGSKAQTTPPVPSSTAAKNRTHHHHRQNAKKASLIQHPAGKPQQHKKHLPRIVETKELFRDFPATEDVVEGPPQIIVQTASIKDKPTPDETDVAKNNGPNTNNYTTLPTSPAKTGGNTSSNDDILSKPEFTSALFKNLPVRPKKGAVPHMDNYCLFDPSIDFFNEKEHSKMKTIPESGEDGLIYDQADDYFLTEAEKRAADAQQRISIEKVEEKIDAIFNLAQRLSSTSSTSSTSPDYPSLLNSTTMDTPPSTTLESSDDSENECGFRNKIFDNMRLESESTAKDGDDESSPTMRKPKIKSESTNKLNLKNMLLDPLKSSFSLPHLQLRGSGDNGNTANQLPRKTCSPLSNIIQKKMRHQRPLSNHSDADSGFVSSEPAAESECSSTDRFESLDELLQVRNLVNFLGQPNMASNFGQKIEFVWKSKKIEDVLAEGYKTVKNNNENN
jgi:hypothetical protein